MANIELTKRLGIVSVEEDPCDESANFEMLRQHNIVAIVPAYNEERFIGSVVLKARKYARTVVVVDDGSSDETKFIAEGAGAYVIRHDVNRGKGASLNTGFQKARELKAEVVALLDGDGQHQPCDIPKMIRPVIDDNVDMVIGSRYLGLESDIPGYRMLGQKAITAMTNIASGIRSTDSWSGFRAFSSRALDCINFREGGWGVDPEFQFQAKEHDFKVAEVPIVALYEEKAKRNPIPHAVKTVNAIIRMVGQHRPLFYFGSAGTILLLAGLMSGLWVYERFRTIGALATGIALISAMCIIIGTLSVFTGVTLHSIRAMIHDINGSKQQESSSK